MTQTGKSFLLGLSISLIVLVSFFGGAIADRIFVIKPLDSLIQRGNFANRPSTANPETQGTLLAPSAVGNVADVVEKTSGSVVTVAVKRQQRVVDPSELGFFGFFNPPTTPNSPTQEVQQDIGTGFVVDAQGLIVTNRHVVSDVNVTYIVIDKNDREHEVKNIYRDPSNDLAILKIDTTDLAPLALGDSDKIRVGQSVIAIGTALGEFRETVTTGVVSGVGRGIEAGNYFGGQTEALENVIQTDAAINPGNSGGPLLDITGSVVGVNVAVSAGAENIGFALPINIVKSSLDNFNQTGQFNRPFLGIRYQMISEQAALRNEVPQGAYLVEIVTNSPAAEAGMQPGDIITEFDGQSVKGKDLVSLINSKTVGDSVKVKYWREDQEKTVELTLKASGS